MKKRLLRLSKRILILTLCTTLLSGSVINRYKITANATSIAVGVGSYAAYEICLYIGGVLLTACGLGAIYDNRDQIAQVGKDFIDSMNLEEVSDWLLTKVNTTGQSYVYGTEALQEIQDMEFTVIQGGGNMPENNNDNDDDGDIDVDDRTKELEQMGMWATTYLVEIMEDGVKPLIEGIRNGEETILSSALPGINDEYFDGIDKDADGKYVFRGYIETSTDHSSYSPFYVDTTSSYLPIVIASVNSSGRIDITLSNNVASNQCYGVIYELYRNEWNNFYGYWEEKKYNTAGYANCYSYSFNVPVFASRDAALNYVNNGDSSGIINSSPKVYQIADWLQEHWTSALEQLNTGIRSLNDNMLIVGEAANQALINQSNGLGYIEDLGNLIATTAPLALPDSIADPIYYPATSPVPELAPEELPWNNPISNPDSPEEEPPYDPDIGEVEVWKVIHGTDTFGLNTLFGSLILLIMILIMLLLIFLSCLAFIIMIFRIPAQTGFLPEEMIAGLDYIKTLEIPGFGMSVYAFFMALIYIILVFTVIGILRKNIDKIKFPRKGRRS